MTIHTIAFVILTSPALVALPDRQTVHHSTDELQPSPRVGQTRLRSAGAHTLRAAGLLFLRVVFSCAVLIPAAVRQGLFNTLEIELGIGHDFAAADKRQGDGALVLHDHAVDGMEQAHTRRQGPAPKESMSWAPHI